MHDFCTSDRCQVTVSLISKYIFFGVQAADGGSYGRCTAVSGFSPVDIDIIVSEYATSYRRNTDGLILDVQLFDHLRDQFMNYAVSTTRTVVHNVVSEEFALLEYEVFLFYNVC